MCYNVQSLLETQLSRAIKTQDLDAIAELRQKLAVYGVGNYYHASGFQHSPMLLEYENKFDVANWGLVPNWINDERAANDIRTKTINARVETLNDKPSFKNAFETGRAVLTVDGFFDFQKKQHKNTPHFLHLEKNQPLVLACVSDVWVNEKSGELLNTFSIVTQPGKGIIEKIHLDKEPRLPVMIEEVSIDNWLRNGQLFDNDLGLSLFSHEVAPLSGKHYKGNVPEVTEESDSINGDQFSLF
jgi:putative SOS response-associated peptidase YedK